MSITYVSCSFNICTEVNSMKRVVNPATRDSWLDMSAEEALMMSHPISKKICAHVMNLQYEAVEAYLQGVLELAELAHIELPGVPELYEAVCTEGATIVIKALWDN